MEKKKKNKSIINKNLKVLLPKQNKKKGIKKKIKYYALNKNRKKK